MPNGSRNTLSRTVDTGLLVLGFLSLTGGIVFASNDPPTGYELSIYTATPVRFWIGVSVAFVVSLFVTFTAGRVWQRSVGLLLAGMSTVATAGLPLVRGYHFYGSNDSLTHLGWARDVVTGTTDPETLFYPAIHLLSIAFYRLTVLSLERSMMLAVLLFVALFLVFVPLSVRTITDSYDAVAIAVFSAAFLLPITNLSTHIHTHPFTQATLFTGMLLFIFFIYVTRSTSPSGLSLNALDLLLAVVSFGLILYHPQQAANVLILFVTVSLVQFVVSRTSLGIADSVRAQRRFYVPTVMFAALFSLWSARYELFFSVTEFVAVTVVRLLTGSPGPIGESVQSQGASLSSLGAGLPEIVFKLMFPSLVLSLIAATLMLAAVTNRLDQRFGDRNAIVLYLTLGLLPITGIFGVYFLGSISEQYFRHWGFMMLIVSVLAPIAYYRLLGGISGNVSVTTLRTAIVGLLVVLLPLALLTVFPSPYLYMPNQQVTDTQMDGYETAFTYHNQSLDLVGIRGGPYRYSDGIQGVAATEDEYQYLRGVSSENMSRLPETEGAPRYLVFSQFDVEREVGAYQGLRYSQSDFGAVRSQPGVHRVSSNGDVELYYIESESGDEAG
jgi:hypothetical protein